MDHGGNFMAAAKAYGFDYADIIDLSTGIAPYPYPLDGVDMSGQHWRDLPQTETEQALIAAMKTHWGCDSSAGLLLAPGSGVVISLAALLRSKTTVLCPDPSYSEHKIAWAHNGHQIKPYPAGQIPQLTADAHVVITVQPGNPTGQINRPEEWDFMIDQMAERDGMLIVDEAFIDLMPDLSMASRAGRKGLLVIRSFGKFYGLAGLRLGAVMGHGDDITRLRQMLGPWAVSTPALEIGLKAISDHAWADEQRQRLSQDMARLTAMLTEAGFASCGGTDLYSLINLDDASALHNHLAKHGIWTRIFDYNPHWMRFGLPADEDQWQRLLSALKAWRQDGN